MQIVVNGTPKTVPEGTTILELLGILDLRPGRVAVELDGQVVPAARHGDSPISPESVLEIVTLVGGALP